MHTKISVVLGFLSVVFLLAGCSRQQATAMSPRQKQAYEFDHLATKAAVAHDIAKAEYYQRQALALEPGDMMLMFSLAKILESAGKKAEAGQTYQKIVLMERDAGGDSTAPYKKAALKEITKLAMQR